MAKDQAHWDQRYREGNLPWDSQIRSRELARQLKAVPIVPCRAIELGCGTGTNAFFLAEQGFDVTAVDISAVVIARTQQQAEQAGLPIDFRAVDLSQFDWKEEPFDFIFDRGCYHCARGENAENILNALRTLSKPGTRYLSLIGNAKAQHGNEPTMTEAEIRAELGSLFQIDDLQEIHLEDAGGIEGPSAWSVLMTRVANAE